MSQPDRRHPSSSVSAVHAIRELERRFQGAALRSLGLVPSDRDRVVEIMFDRRRRDAASYWLQLLLSMGIATVGLVLGSTAVVIGAMLIAPLMGPIVELGMALVVGSPVLTIRSFGRMMASVLAVIGGAALLTLLLPFHEVTAEIASRTSPTALDLLLAIFVALAAAFTTVRSTSETTSAAAGTAIGIALVPPVCVIGFGLGIGDAAIAGGSFLLFVTNLTAILFVSVVTFWALGFDTVDATEWEEAALAQAPPNGAVHNAVRALRAVFGSRYGRVLRVAIPAVMVAAVAVPLSRALDQVAWEVKARSSVARILDQALGSLDAVQSMVTVKQGTVATQLYLVGSPDDATALEQDLLARIAAATGVVPTVRVVSVPDLDAMRSVTVARETPAPASPVTHLPRARSELGAALESVWPGGQLGTVLGWQVVVRDSAAPELVVDYLGRPGGPAVDELLGRSVSGRVGATVAVRARANAPDTVAAALSEGVEWLPGLLQALGSARSVRGLNACVSVPAEPALRRSPAMSGVAGLVRAEAGRLPAGRAHVEAAGDRWSVHLSPAPCVPPAAAEPPRTDGPAG